LFIEQLLEEIQPEYAIGSAEEED